MRYEVDLEHYKGPFDKLLELVEEKKLDITLISLAGITDDFLAYTRELEERHAPHSLIADFLVVASKLVLIKSKVLLPFLEFEEEEEADIKDFERRLKFYQEFKPAITLIKKSWKPSPLMYHREFLMLSQSSFYPPKDMRPELLLTSFLKILGELERVFRPEVTIQTQVILLKKKIEEVLARISLQPIRFRDFHGGASRSEIVVLFLAVLHLVREQLAEAHQDSHCGDIMVAKKEEVV